MLKLKEAKNHLYKSVGLVKVYHLFCLFGISFQIEEFIQTKLLGNEIVKAEVYCETRLNIPSVAIILHKSEDVAGITMTLMKEIEATKEIGESLMKLN